ncbi:MAG TPA: DMT family transporter [Kiloniellales bacterium]|nr:DMT family transporter [Kiloniellales bacterium]
MQSTADIGRRRGVLLVLFSAVAWSAARIFTKGTAADAWAVLFWRGLFAGPLILLYLVAAARQPLWAAGKALGGPGWLVVSVSSLATVAFLNAFKHSSVANVTVVYATAPFVAAGFGWLLLRERPARAALAASLAALSGVAIMVSGSLGTPNLLGDGLALLMTLLMALFVVLVRRFAGRPMVLAAALSSLQISLFAWLPAERLWPGWGDLLLLAAFGALHAGAVVALTEGCRLLPAADTALLSALDTPLAPLLAWLVLGELPPAATFAGGGLVLMALFCYIGRDLRTARPVPS